MPSAPRSRDRLTLSGSIEGTRTTGRHAVPFIAATIACTSLKSIGPCSMSMQSASAPAEAMACEVTGDGVRAKCMVTPRDRVASLDRNAVALFAAGATVHTSRLLAGMARESMARDSVATLVIIPRRGSSHPHSM